MSFPEIKFKITNTEIDDNLKEVAEQKLKNLEKFTQNASCLCEVEFERITNHHQQGMIHRVEVNLQINGELFRAEASDESFEKALDDVKEELNNVLQSARGKKETLFRKGARRVKEMMQFRR